MLQMASRRPSALNSASSSDEGSGSDRADLERGAQAARHASSAKTTSGQLAALGVSRVRLRWLDLRTTEKLWAGVDALQVFALIWSLSQPWPWPRPWLSLTRWVVAINLDIVSFNDAAMAVTGPGTYSSPWGEREDYVKYASLLMVTPVGLQMLWHFRHALCTWWLDRGALFHRIVLGQSTPKPPAAAVVSALINFERTLLLSAHVVYLPVLLGVVRLFVCDSDGTLSVDPSMSCRSPLLVLPSIFGLIVALVFTLDLSKHTTATAHAVATYKHRSDHERFLQRVEIEYALNLCNAWAAQHLWMVSSFRRHAVRYRVFMMYLKLGLVLIYAFVRYDIQDQAVMFWGLLTAWVVWTCAHPPYRCRSSNRLHTVLYMTLWTDCLFGMLTGYGVRSAVLVASTQFHALAAINCAGVVIAACVVVAVPIEEARMRRRMKRQMAEEDCRATSCTIARLQGCTGGIDEGRNNPAEGPSRASADSGESTAIVYPDRWPTRATLLSMARLPRRREWVDAIRKAKEFRFECEMCPQGLEPIRALEAFMRHLRCLWAEAKAEDSMLEPALGSALERLALVHARMYTAAGGRGGGLTSKLEDTLLDPLVSQAIRRRRMAQALMTDRQKRVLLKLLAIAAFLNHRDLRDSSAASIGRLRADTSLVLGRPQTWEIRPHLKTVCMQWKRLIQKSERDFEALHGHPPYLADKEVNSEWYNSYQKVRAALDALPKDVSSCRSSSPGRQGIHLQFPGLAQTPSSKVLTLMRATEQVLVTFTGTQRDDMDVVEAETCRKQWKRAIREWEARFEDDKGHPPRDSDKQAIREFYEYHHRVKSVLPTNTNTS